MFSFSGKKTSKISDQFSIQTRRFGGTVQLSLALLMNRIIQKMTDVLRHVLKKIPTSVKKKRHEIPSDNGNI